MSVYPADQISPGDMIDWTGRPARVLAVLHQMKETRRPGRRFKVLVENRVMLLNYFDDELVPIAVSYAKVYEEARGL